MIGKGVRERAERDFGNKEIHERMKHLLTE